MTPIDRQLSFRDVFDDIWRDIKTGNVKHLLSLGSVYDLTTMDDTEKTLFVHLLTVPNFEEVKLVMLSYLVDRHEWIPLANHVIFFAKRDDNGSVPKTFLILANAISKDETVLIDVFLHLFAQKDIDRIFPEFIVLSATAFPLSKLLSDIPPFPKQKEAVAFAKNVEKRKDATQLLPRITFSAAYPDVIKLFSIAENDSGRITLERTDTYKSAATADVYVQFIEKASAPGAFTGWSADNLHRVQEILIDAGAILNIDSRLLMEATVDTLPAQLANTFGGPSTLLPCRNHADLDVFTQNEVANIPPMFIFVHDTICFELDALQSWALGGTENMHKNPITQRIFSHTDIQRMRVHVFYLQKLAKAIQNGLE